MFVAFVGAMDVEIEYILKALSNIKKEEYRGYTFYLGDRGNNKVVVTKSGVGKVNMAVALTILLDKYHVDYVINSGIAGSYNSKIGSTSISTEVAYYDFIIPGYGFGVPRQPNPYKPSDDIVNAAKEIYKEDKNIQFGKIISGDRFVTDVKDFGEYDYKNSVAVDMESASVAQVCYLFSTDFLIIRNVSDNLSAKEYNANESTEPDNCAKIALKFIDNYNKY